MVVAWLTCEETERRKDTVIGGRTLQKDHGYVFEVDPASQAANVDRARSPLPFLGRYSHEAVDAAARQAPREASSRW